MYFKMMKTVYLMKELNNYFKMLDMMYQKLKGNDMKYELKVPAGTYKHNNLFLLFFKVITHRLGHLIKDGKYMD